MSIIVCLILLEMNLAFSFLQIDEGNISGVAKLFSHVPGVDCQIGTYSNETGLTEESECTACDPGKYCDTPGLIEPAGECDPGHFCESGAIRYSE